MSDLLIRHLADIVNRVPENSIILAGGLGLTLKRRSLVRSDTRTLATAAGYEIPEARATTDIDLFLRIEMFTRKEDGCQLRQALDDLDYVERTPQWQFEKPLHVSILNQPVVVDLLARRPEEGESVKVKTPRVGTGSGINLHGRETVEAFAVERDPQTIEIVCDGSAVGRVCIVHPYGWLNMKVRAAYDWLLNQRQPWDLRENQKPPSEKHAFDVALIAAMVTETEDHQCLQMAEEFRQHPIAQAIRFEAAELFESPSAQGWREAVRQGMLNDHSLIWPRIKEMLGVDS